MAINMHVVIHLHLQQHNPFSKFCLLEIKGQMESVEKQVLG